MSQLYVSVHDGDFTVWLVANGHAWPFDSVQDAFWAGPDFEGPGGPGGGWVHDDDAFRESVTQDDVWWDRLPEPSDSESVAALLSAAEGVAS